MPVTTINPFEVPAGQEAAALTMWEHFAAHFSAQPGYISTRLHRALGSDAKFHLVSISEWESAEHFLAALQHPDVSVIATAMPAGIQTFPGLYTVIRT